MGIGKSFVQLRVPTDPSGVLEVGTKQYIDSGLSGKQAADADLTAIAALDSSTAGALVTDGSGWIRKTYAQLKTALSLTKGDVGLGNCDNTSDANKPVSTAQQTALDGKQPLDADLTTIAGLTATTDNFLQAKSSAWASRTPTQVAADLVTPLSSSLQPLDADLTAIAGLSPSNDDVVQRKSGAWTNRTLAQLSTDLALPELIRDTIGTALVEGSGIDITVDDGSDTITIAVVPAAVYAAPRSDTSVSAATNVDGTVAGDAQYTITANVTFTPTGTPDGRKMLIWVKASGATRTATLASSVELPTSGGPTSLSLSIPSGDLGVFAVSYTTFAGAWMLNSAQVFDL